MLQYLIQLPYASLGHDMLGFLELSDIINLERAAANRNWQQLLKTILPYCPPIVIFDTSKKFKMKQAVCNWFHNRSCRVQEVHIYIKDLHELDFEHSVFVDIKLYCEEILSLEDIQPLKNSRIYNGITSVEIKSNQDPAVMEALFSLFSSVCSLIIIDSNPTKWIEEIKKIGSKLHEVS